MTLFCADKMRKQMQANLEFGLKYFTEQKWATTIKWLKSLASYKAFVTNFNAFPPRVICTVFFSAFALR